MARRWPSSVAPWRLGVSDQLRMPVLVPGFVLVLREHSKHGQRQRHRRRLNWHLARLRARARVCGRLPGAGDHGTIKGITNSCMM